MSNLYPHLNNNNNNKNPSSSQTKLPGSFDDYDSIIDDGFSIGYNKAYDSDDVSSMHMSEMGGVSVNAATATNAMKSSPARSTARRTNGGMAVNGGVAQFVPASVAAARSQGGAMVTANNNNNNNNNTNNHHAAPTTVPPIAILDSTFSTLALDAMVDTSGYYHVGDLGIDTTDVSAILGVASEDPMDEESLLFGTGTGAAMTASSLPPVSVAKNDAVFEKIAQKERSLRDEEKRFGPLGDELSYADAGNTAAINNSNNYPVYIENDDDSQDDYDSEEEEDEYDGILPNWIAFSGQRTKVVFVTSAALILGSLVLAIVAIGFSYGMTDGNNSNNNNGGSEPVAIDQQVEISVPGGDNDINATVANDTMVVPMVYPTFSPIASIVEATGAPVLSTTGEEVANNNNSSPTTNSPSFSLTTANDVSLTSSPPTDGPTAIVTTAELTTASPAPTTSPASNPSSNPSSSRPTLQPASKPSFSPSRSVTTSPSLTKSSIPTNVPSFQPTISLHPSSTHPSAIPSVAPTASSKPSWSFGSEAMDDGDATFYLMADGGSNWQFWTDKLKNLPIDKEEQKFVVHLGSATRVVDNCEETAYFRTQLSLSVTPIPVYSVPGNNDYPECADPRSGWEYYQKHMMNLDTKYWNVTDSNLYQVKRQKKRMENFSFLYKKVLFVGLNMVTNNDDEDETLGRLEDNVEWIEENANAYQDNINAMFLMGYGRLFATENIPFYSAMVAKAKSDEWSDKLIVYARRSSETGIDENVGGAKNFMELRVGNEWPIMDVRVSTKGKDGPMLDFRDAEEDV
eukprot:CAMPEP_0172303032 /NCGR_PEP_ID=MMETSP1058-20130122/4629_1 /TAXON_ID=83371 /ORGANISM="Detonula confervacea, Strain CCMP 353" /LENGTH=797 /DNA_ID=CAMNT_0013013711 /DNA_START=120 /DNA_END=2513 /DNA_ORIENTATION=+